MDSRLRTPVVPTKEDLARMMLYRALPTEKKLEWLNQMREYLVEIWTNNPETLNNRDYLRQL